MSNPEILQPSQILREGKSKTIFQDPHNPDYVIVRAKDGMQAGDGRFADMSGKAILITEMTCNCFELLKRQRIATHYVQRVDDTSFKALKLQMLPLECVARRVAFGSYLKRSPNTPKAQRFDNVITELFYKNDYTNDPYLVYEEETRRLLLHDQSVPLGTGYMHSLPQDILGVPKDQVVADVLKNTHTLTTDVFQVLETAWMGVNAQLVDMKIECGFDPNGKLRVGDSIEADGWRVWPYGDQNRAVDRQNLYNLEQFSKDDIDQTLQRYGSAAELTRRFIS